MLARTLTTALLAGVLALALGACGDAPAEKNGTPPTEQASVSLPATLFVAEAPADPEGVADAKAEAQEGDTIVVRGRVGGPVPFVKGRAVMTIADTELLVACSDRPGDSCLKPWDYCCESPDDIAAYSATVQIVGDDGRPLAVGLEGAGGIEPLDFVVVEGTVGPRPSDKVLVVNATRIHVEP